MAAVACNLGLGSERGGAVAAGWTRSTNRGRRAINDMGLRWLGWWGRSGSVGQWGQCGFMGQWGQCGRFVVASCAGVGDVERVRGWKTCCSWESERLRDLSWMRESEWETGGKNKKTKQNQKKKKVSWTRGIKNYFLFLDVSYSAHLSIYDITIFSFFFFLFFPTSIFIF